MDQNGRMSETKLQYGWKWNKQVHHLWSLLRFSVLWRVSTFNIISFYSLVDDLLVQAL